MLVMSSSFLRKIARAIRKFKAVSDRLQDSYYFKAFTETAMIWSISSLIPMLAIWLVGRTTQKSGFGFPEGLSHSWAEFFVPTEVFLYVTAIIAPSVSFMIVHWQARKHSGMYSLLFSCFGLIFLFTAIVYAVSKTSTDLDHDFIHQFAITVYLLALLAWYVTQVFEYRLNDLVGRPQPESGSSISLDPEE